MSKLVDELRDAVTDWDGSQMKDEEEPRRILPCGVLRQAADRIEQLERALEILKGTYGPAS